MLEILQFIFSSFWIWLGTLILVSSAVSVFGYVVAAAILAVRGKS